MSQRTIRPIHLPAVPFTGIRGWLLGLLTVSLLGLNGCGSGPEEAPPLDEGTPSATEVPVNQLTTLEYADSLRVDFEQMQSTPSGLYYQDIVVGTGAEAEAGATVTVHYSGFLANGFLFDSSRDKPTSFQATLETGRVISGWVQGVPGMRVGGQRKLVIPPELAYGTAGVPQADIPPNAVLVFDVELLEVH